MIDTILGGRQTVLQGAYGRRYTSWIKANADWYAGLDFKIEGGPYCSIRDAKSLKDLGNLYFRINNGTVPI
jgi:hypothetical protein